MARQLDAPDRRGQQARTANMASAAPVHRRLPPAAQNRHTGSTDAAFAQELAMDGKSSFRIIAVLALGLSGSALAQVVSSGDPSAPPSPTLDPTTTTRPSANAAAHSRNEVLAYVVAIDDLGYSIALQGRDRRLDGDIRSFAASMLTEHRDSRMKTRALAAELNLPLVDTTDVRSRRDLGGSELDALGKASDNDYPARFLDAVTEFDTNAIDLIDKRLRSDAADDPRITTHLDATRTRLAAQLLRANELRSAGK
jgi:hypothetical protein